MWALQTCWRAWLCPSPIAQDTARHGLSHSGGAQRGLGGGGSQGVLPFGVCQRAGRPGFAPVSSPEIPKVRLVSQRGGFVMIGSPERCKAGGLGETILGVQTCWRPGFPQSNRPRYRKVRCATWQRLGVLLGIAGPLPALLSRVHRQNFAPVLTPLTAAHSAQVGCFGNACRRARHKVCMQAAVSHACRPTCGAQQPGGTHPGGAFGAQVTSLGAVDPPCMQIQVQDTADTALIPSTCLGSRP